ncbi:MAG: precorrin-8X methylmutase [Desulfovibrio sp.]|nr:precorrin-8X methylmutase [Desulfovibrio sp.]
MKDLATHPKAIESRSFAIIDQLIPPPRRFEGVSWCLARRLIHTLGDTEIYHDLCITEDAIRAALFALSHGAPIYTDTTMAKVGIRPQNFLAPSLQPRILALMEQTSSRDPAKTRAAQAVEDAAPHMGGAIVAIGNAPTALLALLDCLDQGMPPPALVIGMPVGFVNAAYAKDRLHESPYPHITLLGTKGGSAVAAACVNALFAILASQTNNEQGAS